MRLVHINQVEFENFKSFGGNVKIPLEEGFTVVTGPNGSGKSNILDGILFCLGLANSRGMRAERLPDLINNSKVKEGKSSETSVSVKFNIQDWSPREDLLPLELEEEEISLNKGQKEWVVSRKLRLMPGGSYASTYTSDGKQCTLQQIQRILRDISVDPEGSNVVMQGDVTRIVSMNNKERRNLIDELAGVALFDTRIEQTNAKLNDVFERQERCEILENELQSSKNKLEKECEKAKRYKELKAKLLQITELEKVLIFEKQVKHVESIERKESEIEKNKILFNKQKESISKEILVLEDALKILVDELKEKGEDKLIKVNSDIGSINSSLRELDRISILNKEEGIKLQKQRDEIAISKRNIESEKMRKENFDEKFLNQLNLQIDDLTSKQSIKLNTELESIKNQINPLEIKKRKIEEEIIQNNIQKDEILSQIECLDLEKQKLFQGNQSKKESSDTQNKNLASNSAEINSLENEIDLLIKTKSRLNNEQLRLEKDLSRFESRKEALNESRGSYALRILLEAGLEGIHGYVAQLGEVSEKNRYALEIAAGNRLGQIVVDNDHIAAKAIEILKKKKAGRLTFLPLNRIKSQKKNYAISRFENNRENGFIDKAINLISFDEVYSDVFRYVFGDTLVFSDLSSARLSTQKNRLVTLSGELLEASGAITGGSKLNKDLAYRFGMNNDIDDSSPIKERLLIIEEALKESNNGLIIKNNRLSKLNSNRSQIIEDCASFNKEIEVNQDSLKVVSQRIEDFKSRLNKLDTANNLLVNELGHLKNELKPYHDKFNQLQSIQKANYEKNQKSSLIAFNDDFNNLDKKLELLINERNTLLDKKNQFALDKERINNSLKITLLQEKNLQESIKQLAIAHSEWIEKRDEFKKELLDLDNQKNSLERDLGLLRRKRDELNSSISNKRQEYNNYLLKLEYLERDMHSLKEEMRSEKIKLENYKKDLPNPSPQFGEYEGKSLESLQSEISIINAKLQSLEPVNMLALDELEELIERLNGLREKLEILSNERSELLLRIETVSTMRQEAFMQAFTEVDKHFREIFANLSDGDGFLQLENPNSPLEGGLTLVAHPKGKNVRRLASMSGGEKSLTALSFLFALQKYKPSPFYALDEVDSFLDGINVERLSKLISNQSSNAQFIVVSHRRPMISASERTIGVAQARGANTQVLGLPNAA
ncbi:chromosome segregation protein SMC [uncultured Prochlorococcus sp.]|uniref:chromosome segregation protein SMC n=1 Tax=uncultured Prochlorococcus sp. TaxID=159733 RepID=UPI0025876AA3|nr:chromosome segregation protein SMC [uncultured Prochlorococcus sp.]